MNLIHQFGLSFMAFFAIMNPVSSLPVYISLTEGDNKATAREVARKGLLIAFGIIAVFSVGGQFIFNIFGISLPALRLAGGILVFLIGFHMLQGKSSAAQKMNEAETPDESQGIEQSKLGVAITPLAMPLLAGPGAIATAMSLSAHNSLGSIAVTIAAFALLCLITYGLFLYSAKLIKLIGESAMSIMTRMMGLILAVIGMQMIIGGAQGAFPALMHS